MKYPRAREKGTATTVIPFLSEKMFICTAMLATIAQVHESEIAVASNVAETIDLWLYGKSHNTQQAYRRDIQAFLCFVEGKSPERWTVNDLQAFGTALQSQGLKPSTVNRKLLAVKSLLSYAHKLGLVPANAGAAVSTPRLKDSTNERILPEGKILEMIYGEPHPIHRLMIKLLYATGLRVSELTQLRWQDAAEQGDAIALTICGKGRKTRYVLVKKSLWAELSETLPRQGEYVFSTRTGKPWDRKRVLNLVKEAGGRVGIPGISPHWLRHSHASHSLDRGCPIHTVQKSLGHSSLETTQRYLHSKPDDGSGLHLAV